MIVLPPLHSPVSSSFLIPSLPHSSAALLTPELFCVHVASSFSFAGGVTLCHIVKQRNRIPRSLGWYSSVLGMLPSGQLEPVQYRTVDLPASILPLSLVASYQALYQRFLRWWTLRAVALEVRYFDWQMGRTGCQLQPTLQVIKGMGALQDVAAPRRALWFGKWYS